MRLGLFSRFIHDQSGATAMEYALLAALIGIAIVGSFAVLGDGVANMFVGGGTADVLNEQTAKIPNN